MPSKKRENAKPDGVVVAQNPPKQQESAAHDEVVMTSVNYRYTKNPPVLNDLLGYGERIEEVFYIPREKNRLVLETRCSQRTRTGRQVLEPL
jgi:hypothetical protein